MQCRVDLVAGHRRAKGHFRGFFVTHLAHQDDIRILAHQRFYAAGEVHAGGLVDRGLANQREWVLYRIFQRHDVDLFAAKVIQQRVKRGGFTATGRAGDQDDALGSCHHDLQRAQRFRG